MVPPRAQVSRRWALLALLAWPADAGAQNEPQLKVPAGLAIEVLYLSDQGAGRIYRIRYRT